MNELEQRQRLKDDFVYYARNCLMISTKEGKLIPFELNKAQLYIHECIEKQLKEKGYVRILGLKGRQQGFSTYVEGRFMWQVTHSFNIKAFILTNVTLATKNLYEMVKLFYKHLPSNVKPNINKNNATELDFNTLGSGYRVGTAGSADIGRSATLQKFHGSEVAYWPNSDMHVSGILQAIGDVPRTEIILESTAAGANGLFYKMCKDAMDGKGEYGLVFIPWFWQEEYRKELPTGFKLTKDEKKYKKDYDLDDKQMYWRRVKIDSPAFDITAFRREYPATPEEAFKAEAIGALWTRENIRHITPEAYEKLKWDDSLSDEENENDGRYGIIETVQGYDPAVKGKSTSDEHGLIITELLENDNIYVLSDCSAQMKPQQAVPTLIQDFYRHDADRINVEVNNGGEWIPAMIEMEDDTIPVQSIHAIKGKKLRAGPCAHAYRKKRVYHVGYHTLLEDEMVGWNAGDPDAKSPNRVDALCYCILDHLGLLDNNDDLPPLVSKV